MDCFESLLSTDGLFVKELIHKVVARLRYCLKKHIVVFLGYIIEGFGNFALDIRTGSRFKCINNALNEVDKADNLVTVNQRNLDRADGGTECIAQRAKCFMETAENGSVSLDDDSVFFENDLEKISVSYSNEED